MSHAVNVNFRMDSELKKNMESVCDEIGLTMTAAFTIFSKRVVKERKIPFELSADPFYLESNISELEKRIADIKANKNILEHQLIEED